MTAQALLKKRIRLNRLFARALRQSVWQGSLESERAESLSNELAKELRVAENLETLQLILTKAVKTYAPFKTLKGTREELQKRDLDLELAELLEEAIIKGRATKALHLGEAALTVYANNPEINLDDFKLEMLKKWQSLTKKKLQKKAPIPVPKPLAKVLPTEKIQIHSLPPEEGITLQADEVFGAPGSTEPPRATDEIPDPEIPLAAWQEKGDKLKHGLGTFGKLLGQATGEVTKDTANKLKDKSVEWLAKIQEKLGKK